MSINCSTLAFRIKKEKIRENDALYFFYTQKFGKITLLAKGSQKIKAKLSGHLEPPCLVQIDFVTGKINRLIGALEKENYFNIKKNETALLTSFKIINLFNELIIFQEPDKKIWKLLYNSFFLLEKNLKYFPEINDFIFLFFNSQLLTYLGFAPQLSFCQLCQTKKSKFYFSFKEKGIVCEKDKEKNDIFISPLVLRYLKILFSQEIFLQKIVNKQFINSLLKEKEILEKIIFEFTKGILH